MRNWVAEEEAKAFQVVYCWGRASDDLGFFDGHFVKSVKCAAVLRCMVTTSNPGVTRIC